MSEQATAPEPTMEEILASIRRIISEDDAPEGEAPAAAAPESPAPESPALEAAAPAAAPEPEPAPVAAQAPEEDVLELTQRIEAAGETVGDIAAYPAREPEPAPRPAPAPAPPPKAADEEETLVSETSAMAAASAFTNLTAAIALPPAGRTLEDLTRDLLRPMLKDWLDANLPRIVEAKVAEEVERIARIRVR
ncbi:MAG: DUF2497 domain-containing protein [Caulobacteraceae bacterium]|nr:DUF2497 domain-containing protein [Caulobacteraceae bacterium]